MVHTRVNASESNPNPHINFITALPYGDGTEQESARQLLRALAAQVKPVMKAHGFAVNSFEEYEYNRVFAGRNWNHGETVELVLRSANGSFLPTSWLMSTLCHELAHIKHMNHGPEFQALWSQLRKEVSALQRKGYYGDGYWSSGTRLADSRRVDGEFAFQMGDMPKYICGGAHSSARPPSLSQGTRGAGSSNRTGAQTTKKRKAGSRVKAKNAFVGGGQALNADIRDEAAKKAGTGFGKKAASKRAREERALAAERRLLALQQAAGPSTLSVKQKQESDSESDSDIEVLETDDDRRKRMFDIMSEADLNGLQASLNDFWGDFILPSSSSNSSTSKGKRSANDVIDIPDDEPAPPPTKKPKLSYGELVKNEVQLRKKEALDMIGSGRKLSSSSARPPPDSGGTRQSSLLEQFGSTSKTERKPSVPETITVPIQNAGSSSGSSWACSVCTLVNESNHLACSACATPRGESTWSGVSV